VLSFPFFVLFICYWCLWCSNGSNGIQSGSLFGGVSVQAVFMHMENIEGGKCPGFVSIGVHIAMKSVTLYVIGKATQEDQHHSTVRSSRQRYRYGM